MSLLPPPFKNSLTGSFSSASFLSSGETKTAHFPPWYSGSDGNSKIRHHLSQNRTVQLGAPPVWSREEARTSSELPLEWSTTLQRTHGGGHHNRNFNNKPGNLSFYCDACNKGFGDRQELGEHQATHVKCPFEKCSFRAHPKVVALHQKLQHSTGLADELTCLDTPEGIRRWREDRKRNFPTAANVERKKKEEAEKLARGEGIQDKFFGKMKQGGRNGNAASGMQAEHTGRGRGRRRHRKRGANRRQKQSSDPQPQDGPIWTDAGAPQPSSVPAADLQRVQDAKEDDNCDSEDEVRRSRCPSPLAVNKIGGSLSLLAGYGSDSDQEEENECSSRRKRARPLPKPVPDLYPVFWNQQPSKKRPSLLEKLLSSEIRHERNIILQCLHYTVKRNFFDKQQ